MSTSGLVGYVDWTPVIVSGIAAVPATIAAVGTLVNGHRLKTPNGRTLGKMVSQTHDLVASASPVVAAVAERECIPYTDPDEPSVPPAA